MPTNLLKDPEKRKAWVVFQLKQQGNSVANIARQNDVTRQTLYSALIRPYPRMERILADALNLSAQALFPERYDHDGLPNRKPGRTPNHANKSAKNKHNTRSRTRNVQIRKAA